MQEGSQSESIAGCLTSLFISCPGNQIAFLQTSNSDSVGLTLEHSGSFIIDHQRGSMFIVINPLTRY